MIDVCIHTGMFTLGWLLFGKISKMLDKKRINNKTNTIQEFEKRTVESLLNKKAILISDFDKTYENKATRYKLLVGLSVIL